MCVCVCVCVCEMQVYHVHSPRSLQKWLHFLIETISKMPNACTCISKTFLSELIVMVICFMAVCVTAHKYVKFM